MSARSIKTTDTYQFDSKFLFRARFPQLYFALGRLSWPQAEMEQVLLMEAGGMQIGQKDKKRQGETTC
jgi:hypothetical protein